MSKKFNTEEIISLKGKSDGFDGVFCRATKENYELLVEYGFKMWGGVWSVDGIYAIDADSSENDFVPLDVRCIPEYREFIFVDSKPVFKEAYSIKSTELFSTPKDFLKIKKAPNHNFYYTERKGIDSVSIILINSDDMTVGLTREAKPPFSEREGVPLAFKLTALGGSLFDMVPTEEYLKMSEEERTRIVALTAQKEVLEEAGYEVQLEDIEVLGKVVFNSMSNEYVYLCCAFVSEANKVQPDPQNHLESLAQIEWVTIGEDLDIECGKTLATILKMGLKSCNCEKVKGV